MQEGAGKLAVQGRHVVIVEDIVDTGHTLQRLRKHVVGLGAASVAVAALLDKQVKRVVEVDVEYAGFVCPDEFVVGCALASCSARMTIAIHAGLAQVRLHVARCISTAAYSHELLASVGSMRLSQAAKLSRECVCVNCRYGLDYAEKYRSLPYIGVLRQDAI